MDLGQGWSLNYFSSNFIPITSFSVSRNLLFHFAILCGAFGTPIKVQVESKECVTAPDSKVPNTSCVFPFTHNGVLYAGCPTDPTDKTKRWCSTKTDENGIHVDGIGNFGFCSGNCPVHVGLG